MKKLDEIQLYAALRNSGPHPGAQVVDATAQAIGMPGKRAVAILEKWERAGWWEVGVSIGSGWFSPSAPQSIGAL